MNNKLKHLTKRIEACDKGIDWARIRIVRLQEAIVAYEEVKLSCLQAYQQELETIAKQERKEKNTKEAKIIEQEMIKQIME